MIIYWSLNVGLSDDSAAVVLRTAPTVGFLYGLWYVSFWRADFLTPARTKKSLRSKIVAGRVSLIPLSPAPARTCNSPAKQKATES